MIIEFASEVSNLAWRVSQSQNGGAIFTLTKWSPMFGSVVFDHQWCILIVMSVKSSFYNEYDIKNNEKHVLWAQRSFQNHHQTFHDRCPEKIGPLPKKSDHWFTRTCPENIRPAPTRLRPIAESRTRKPAMVTLKIQPDCSTVHDTFLWANIYVRSHLGCGIDSVSSVFCRSHKYFKDANVTQINRILKIS